MESVIEKLGKASITVEKDYHSSKKEYNKLTVVEEQGAFKTYISRKPVPVGVALTNREYWICFSGVLESITFDYLKFKRDYASGKALENNSIITRHILDRNIERIKIALKAISEEEIDDDAVIERAIKDRNVTSNKIAKENILTEHFAKKSVITAILADYAVTAIKLADNSVTTRTIVNENVTQEKLAIGIQSLINNLSKTATFAGIAIPTTNPGTPEAKVYYIANGNGIYDNFGGIEVTENEVVIMYYDDRWHKITTGIASQKKLIELNEKVNSLALGKFYGYFPNSSSLPVDITISGYAYVGLDSPYKIWNFNGKSWSDSGTSIDMNDADEEDITRNADGKLQFKDKEYGDGMGYIILRKNKSFAEQVTKANTIYEIRYRFDLLHDTVSLPTNCILKFEGGELYNGTIKGENTYIEIGKNYPCLFCDFEGSFCTEVIKAEWFDIIPNGDGTVSNTINQHGKFEKLNNYINCTTTVELHFKSGFYGFGGGSDTNKYLESAAKWNNYYAIHIGDDTKCRSLVIKGNGAKFVNVFPMKIGTWNDDWTPKCKNNIEWNAISDSDKWKVSSYGGGFLICNNKTKDITIRIQDLSVDMHREIFIFGGYQKYTCNQTSVVFHSFGNLYMDNCHFKGNVCDGGLVLSSKGFYPKNIVITNCIFEDNIRCGFACDGGLNILVKGCKFINNGQIYIPNGNTYYKFENPYIAFSVEGNINGNTNIEDFYIEDCYFENNNRGCIAVPNMNVRSATIDKCIVNNTKPVLDYSGDTVIENKHTLGYFASVYAEEKVSITNCTLNNAIFHLGKVIHNPTNESTEGKAEGDLYWNEIQQSTALVDNISINCSHLDSLPASSIILIDFSTSLYNYKVVSGKWTQFIATEHQGGCGKVIIGTIIVNIRNGYRVLYRQNEVNYAAPIFINNAIINFLEPITQEPFFFNRYRTGILNNITICDYNCQETTPYQLNAAPLACNLTIHQFGTKQSIKLPKNIGINGVSTNLDNFPTKQLSYLIGAYSYTKFIHGGYINNNVIDDYNKKDYGINSIVSTVPYMGGSIGNASTIFYRRLNFSSPWETLYGNFTHGYNKSWCADVNTLKEELAIIGYSKSGSKLAAGDICYDKSNKQLILGNNSRTDFYRYDGNPYGIAESGTRSQRPIGVKIGTMYFDTSLDTPRPIYWSGTKWVDATGADV